MMRHTTIPMDAAQTAAIMLFLPELKMDFLVIMVFQYLKVMFPGAIKGFPIFTVIEVINTDIKGITTTTTPRPPCKFYLYGLSPS